jgi:hypothetical protein
VGEASTDAARPDARRDVVLPDAGEGWRAIMPFGAGCKYYALATEPEKVLPVMVDTACETAPFNEPGTCVEWDRSPWYGQYGGLMNVFPGWQGTTMFAYARHSTSERYESLSLVYDVRARRPLFGQRYLRFSGADGKRDDGCDIGLRFAGPLGPALIAREPNFSFVVQPLSDYPDKLVFRELSPPRGTTQDVADDLTASDTIFAFHALGPIYRVKRSDYTWVTTRVSGLDKPFVINDEVILRDRGNRYEGRISRMEPTGDVTVIRAVPGVALTGATLDGAHLYWLAQVGGVPPNVVPPRLEVWRSVYTNDIAAFNAGAERVAVYEGSTFNWYPNFFVRGGVAVVSNGTDTLAIRLSDGRSKRFTPSSQVERVIPYLAEPDTMYFVYSYPVFGKSHLARISLDW